MKDRQKGKKERRKTAMIQQRFTNHYSRKVFIKNVMLSFIFHSIKQVDLATNTASLVYFQPNR